jgi:hypothetical protein
MSVTARIEVFRPGTFTPMKGAALTFSAADLRAVADAYDRENAPAPIVVGHPEVDAPAYGWVERLEYDPVAERLFAEVGEIDPAFAEAVKAGRYKKVSLSFFPPTAAANPAPGTWYPRHVGFLGGAAPGVPGLKNVAFSIPDAEAVTFAAAFAETAFEETSSLFRSLRDFFIEKFGLDDADKALPAWRIEWLGSVELDRNRPGFSALSTAAAELSSPAPLAPPDPAFADRDAALDLREAGIAAREAAIARTGNADFAERLVADGRLLPSSKARLIAILDALPGHATVSFAEGEALVPAGDALRAILVEQPPLVLFGAMDLPAGGAEHVAAFAADGAAVDPEQLEVHRKAEAHQRANPGTDYLAAVRAVS